jgi:hypothetical protein
MLEGLSQVPWAALEHAYGSASDVPDLIRTRRSPDPEVRKNARWHLYGNIFYQGTRTRRVPMRPRSSRWRPSTGSAHRRSARLLSPRTDTTGIPSRTRRPSRTAARFGSGRFATPRVGPQICVMAS